MEEPKHIRDLRDLIGNDVLLLRCQNGSKRPVGKWKHLTATIMNDRPYLAMLGKGNIGVALGPVSNGLCSLDIDTEQGLADFANLNQEICQTLFTRGSRGGNYWWRLKGTYPKLTPMKVDGVGWGEWRSNGAQTIIYGTHPLGMPYQIIKRLSPRVIEFNQIKWPTNLQPFSQQELSVTESPERTERTELSELTQETEGTDGDRSGMVVPLLSNAPTTLMEVLAFSKTTGLHTSHAQIFTLARGIKALEALRSSPFSDDELMDAFKQWFAAAKSAGHLRPGISFDEYRFEFMEGYENARHALGIKIVDLAWTKSATATTPAAANIYQDNDLRRLVTLCRELASLQQGKPFFISCRSIQALFGHSEHVRGARWLRGLVRDKILEVVEPGGNQTMRATRYRYKKPL